jgi:hypothetical protein
MIYQMSTDASFRIASPNEVIVSRSGEPDATLSLRDYRILLEFVEPRTREQVFDRVGTDIPLADFYRLVMTLEGRRLLVVKSGDSRGAETPFRELFNRGIFDDDATVDRVSQLLDEGRAVVIPNAFQTDFAERVWRGIDSIDHWHLQQDVYPIFHSRNHNVLFERQFPPPLLECKRVFGSENAKEWMSRVSRRDCMGPIEFGASLYLPGDHNLPHRDAGVARSMAFVWNLTREWQDDWGGGFFWCPSGTTVVPRFNTLVLFNTSLSSLHFVTLVSPFARGKRLAVSGWWSRTPAAQVTAPKPTRRSTDIVRTSHYGPEPVFLDGEAGIVAV